MRVYYAHSKRIYGTKREERELRFLKKKFSQIVDPNKDIGEKGNVNPYLKVVSDCNIMVCSEFKKHIGVGVFQEVKYALGKKKEVLCLRRKHHFYFRKVKTVRIIDETDSSVKYGKLVLDGRIIKGGIK